MDDSLSYIFFYHAIIQQLGTVTCIVSGCNDEPKEKTLQDFHENHVRRKMSDRFHLHFSPGKASSTSQTMMPLAV